MTTRVKLLKVKIKSLAEEARIIRLEEGRAKGRRKCGASDHAGLVKRDDCRAFVGRDDDMRERLHRHRVRDVRPEQRASLLAYAFLRGRPLAAVEPRRGAEWEWQAAARWKRVGQLVEKFGTVSPWAKDKAAQADAFKAWAAAGPVAA